MKDHNIRLFDIPALEENITEIGKHGGIKVTGAYEGFGKTELVTVDIGEAIRDVELILVVVPAFAHESIAKACAPHLEDGQIVVLNPGSTFGALEFSNTLKKAGCTANVTVG